MAKNNERQNTRQMDDQQVDGDDDDGRLQARMRENRVQIMALLMDSLTAILSAVSGIDVLTAKELQRIRNKQRRNQKVASLFDCLIKKNGRQLGRFLEAIKSQCTAIYDIFSDVPRPRPPMGYLPPDVALARVEATHQQSWETLLDTLTDPCANVWEFHRKLKVVFCKGIEITLVRSGDGFNILHEMVRLGKTAYMECLQYNGVWSKLYMDPVDRSNSEGGGKTPLQLARSSNKPVEANEIERIQEIETGLTAMAKAARSGDVRQFLSTKNDNPVKVTNLTIGGSVLDWACASGSSGMIREVIKAEMDVAFLRADVINCLKICVTLGQHHLLQIINAYKPADLNKPTIEGRTLVEKCAQNGDWDTLRALERLGAVLPATLPAVAASFNKIIVIQKLIERRFGMNFQDKRKKSALHFAAEKLQTDSVRLLIEGGADILLKDKRNWTPLHSAANAGSAEIVMIIVKAARAKNCMTELLQSRDRYLGSECCFLVRGRDENTSAWHYVEADRALLDIFKKRTQGGSVDIAKYGNVIRSGWGYNPSPEVAKEEEAKYDLLNIPEDRPVDMLAVHVAVVKNHQRAAIQLIRLMSTDNATDRFGHTLLHLAAMRGNIPVINALLECGADKLAVDRKMRTPYDVAVANEHPEAAALLRAEAAMSPAESEVNSLSITSNPSFSSRVESTPETSSHSRKLFSMEGLRKSILETHKLLSPERLEESRRKGRLTERDYILSLLRNLNGDVNDYIYDNLGTSHITTPTDTG